MVINSRFGSAVVGIQTVGAIDGGLPPWFTPDLTRDILRRIASAVIAVAILGHPEAVSTARALALRAHQRIDDTQEWLGQGLSNIFGNLFSAYAAGGSLTRSGVSAVGDLRRDIVGLA